MIGDIQLHHITAQLGNFIGLGFDFHARFYGGSAGGGETATAFNLNQTDSARAKGFKLICGTEAWNFDTALGGGAHHRGALWHCDFNAINTQGYQLGAGAFWGTVICLGFVEFQHISYLLYLGR